MCLPAAVVAGISVATSVVSAAVQYTDAKGQARRARERAVEARRRAVREGNEGANEIRVGALQRRVAIAQELEDLRTRALRARGSAAASAATAGVGGQSIEAILANFTAEEGRFRTGLSLQEDANKVRDDFQHRRLERDIDARLFGITPNVQAPSFALAALNIAASGVKAAEAGGLFDPED